LTVPTSPDGARTASPTRRASGEPFVDTLVDECCRLAEREPAGEEGMEDVVLESDLRPNVEDLFDVEVVEYVGDTRPGVPSETRGGACAADPPRANLLPPSADGRPTGVGVEYIPGNKLVSLDAGGGVVQWLW
jgi:hypothetical protein